MTATAERFHAMVAAAPDDDSELRAAQEWVADDLLARQGGRRTSEWTWENWPETPGQFEANIAALRERIGQPWSTEDPTGAIVQEWQVDQIEEMGPIQYQLGSCWAVRV